MPQEAFHKAAIRISNLRESLPGKVGTILTCLDEIINEWEEKLEADLLQFPFNQLYGQIKALADSVKSEFDDLDQRVDRTSLVYEQVISLYHRFQLSSEFISASKIFEGVERRFQRIDEVLPPKNYAVRELLSELATESIGPAIIKRLETAVHRFDRQEYKAVLQECGQAGEAMFALYKASLSQAGCNEIPSNVGPALDRVRSWLATGENKDKDGLSFARRNRFEWVLLSMFEILHYLRNAASHAPEVEEVLPRWQRRRRESFTEKPEYARLSLCLCFQIALELQVLLDHQGKST